MQRTIPILCQTINSMRPFAIFFSIALLFLSCNKNSIEDRNTVLGLWKMSSVNVSSGAGPGTWEAPLHPSYLEFTTDQKMIFTDNNVVTTYSYSVMSDSTINVGIASNVDTLYRYNLQSNVLTLIAPCFEGCVYKYKAVSNK